MNLEIHQMSIAEKMRIMEELWDDLCHHAQDIDSPSWHQDVLSQREELLSNNQAIFVDWEEAKKKIREDL